MTAIVYDYADIASRVKGDPLIKPKPPEPEVLKDWRLVTRLVDIDATQLPIGTNLPSAKWRLLNQGKPFRPEEDI